MMEYFGWKQLNIYGIARELIPGVAHVNISNWKNFTGNSHAFIYISTKR